MTASNSGEARNALAVAGGAGEAAGADRFGAPGHRDRPAARFADLGQRHCVARMGERVRGAFVDARDRAGRGDARMADEGVPVPPPALVGRCGRPS